MALIRIQPDTHPRKECSHFPESANVCELIPTTLISKKNENKLVLSLNKFKLPWLCENEKEYIDITSLCMLK